MALNASCLPKASIANKNLREREKKNHSGMDQYASHSATPENATGTSVGSCIYAMTVEGLTLRLPVQKKRSLLAASGTAPDAEGNR